MLRVRRCSFRPPARDGRLAGFARLLLLEDRDELRFGESRLLRNGPFEVGASGVPAFLEPLPSYVSAVTPASPVRHQALTGNAYAFAGGCTHATRFMGVHMWHSTAQPRSGPKLAHICFESGGEVRSKLPRSSPPCDVDYVDRLTMLTRKKRSLPSSSSATSRQIAAPLRMPDLLAANSAIFSGRRSIRAVTFLAVSHRC